MESQIQNNGLPGPPGELLDRERGLPPLLRELPEVPLETRQHLLDIRIQELEEAERKLANQISGDAYEEPLDPVTKLPKMKLTHEFLKRYLNSNPEIYIETEELNTDINLSGIGIRVIENLRGFTGLKVLKLDRNEIVRIQGLETMRHLTSLSLSMNLISKIEGLEHLKNLATLNLSENLIEKIINLHENTKLEHLDLSMNKIGLHGLTDIIHLAEYKSLSSLNLSLNFIDAKGNKDTEQKIIDIFAELENLGVLHLFKNPIEREMGGYRKHFLAKCKNLKQLDTEPVIESERRFADAYSRGGQAELEAERSKYQKEAEFKDSHRTDYLKEMLKNKDMVRQNMKQGNESLTVEAIKSKIQPPEEAPPAEQAEPQEKKSGEVKHNKKGDHHHEHPDAHFQYGATLNVDGQSGAGLGRRKSQDLGAPSHGQAPERKNSRTLNEPGHK